ncbi:hypothetical protein FB565_001439 [Actinoplanes lutulentus]|uniref:Uncharacterized protein n=1 Tax=Actinoplanes lutulentus TaxID=1287878 RepID=A0A327ZEG8_9ACTN|nr:hypothetical protein [Actinoplanes lutulentus]RAK39655.1 hypothetical protein B0I29_104192 [Actinoplanes lutulentus]
MPCRPAVPGRRAVPGRGALGHAGPGLAGPGRSAPSWAGLGRGAPGRIATRWLDRAGRGWAGQGQAEGRGGVAPSSVSISGANHTSTRHTQAGSPRACRLQAPSAPQLNTAWQEPPHALALSQPRSDRPVGPPHGAATPSLADLVRFGRRIDRKLTSFGRSPPWRVDLGWFASSLVTRCHHNSGECWLCGYLWGSGHLQVSKIGPPPTAHLVGRPPSVTDR